MYLREMFCKHVSLFYTYLIIGFNFYPNLDTSIAKCSYLQDLGQLIVERCAVINHLFPMEEERRTRQADITLRSLIHLYTSYLRKAKEPDRSSYTWVSNATGLWRLETVWTHLAVSVII